MGGFTKVIDRIDQAYSSLAVDEKKVFDAIVLSLIAIFYPVYEYDATTLIVEIGGNHFKFTGTTIRSLGYKVLFKNTAEEKEPIQILPELSQGDSLVVDSVVMLDKKTVPPKEYNDETIVKVMEKYGIGTSATRAEIIKKLQNPKRQFITREKGKYSVTKLGEECIRIVPNELKAPELTQRFEADLQKVNEGALTKDAFIDLCLAFSRRI